ncbi:MAG: MBL fold metallo-hydrolase [Kiritimatiellia bacterium]
MNIKIVYDNQAEAGFRCGWGFSALVNSSTLFDTGENTESLSENLERFGVDPVEIDRVVLSHEDWDHVGGIGILKSCGEVSVYVPSSFSTTIRNEMKALNPEAELVDVKDSIEIDRNFVVTAELGALKKEISLVVRTGTRLVLIVGCSHPGLDKIMDEARNFGEILGVIGGFHGFSNIEKLSGIPVIAPTHCTQKKREIHDAYPSRARNVAAGTEITDIC